MLTAIYAIISTCRITEISIASTAYLKSFKTVYFTAVTAFFLTIITNLQAFAFICDLTLRGRFFLVANLAFHIIFDTIPLYIVYTCREILSFSLYAGSAFSHTLFIVTRANAIVRCRAFLTLMLLTMSAIISTCLIAEEFIASITYY